MHLEKGEQVELDETVVIPASQTQGLHSSVPDGAACIRGRIYEPQSSMNGSWITLSYSTTRGSFYHGYLLGRNLHMDVGHLHECFDCYYSKPKNAHMRGKRFGTDEDFAPPGKDPSLRKPNRSNKDKRKEMRNAREYWGNRAPHRRTTVCGPRTVSGLLLKTLIAYTCVTAVTATDAEFHN